MVRILGSIILDAIKDASVNLNYYVCQSPLVTPAIEYLQRKNGNVNSMGNFLAECWSQKLPFIEYGLAYFLYNKRKAVFEPILAKDIKPANSVILVRDANCLDKTSQHPFVHWDATLLIFQNRSDIDVARKNYSLDTMNYFAHIKME